MSDESIKKDWAKIKAAHEETAPVEEALETEKPALEHPSYQALEEQLLVAQQEKHEYWEKLMRTAAEVDNIRRRAERDIANAHLFGQEKMVMAMLPVGDSLEQAIALAKTQEGAGLYEGLCLTQRVFLEALEKMGVQQIDPLGLAFDPNQHEAMSAQPSDEVAPNTVLVVYQKGYLMHERVVRPARVIVSK